MMITVFGVLSLLITLSTALYSSTDDVVQLTPSNFNEKVISSNQIWFVEFYAPWCGHCKALAPEWKKAATALKGIVNIGAVDADQHNSLGGQYGVRGFPTIKIFGLNKNSPSDYNGGRDANGIIDAAISEIKKVASSRMGKGSSGSGNTDSSAVIKLTDSNFNKLVLQSDDIWLVEFYAPWCGHCKRLEPEWAKAANELKGVVKLGALDATSETVTAGKYEIRGYPTIKIFGKSISEKENPVDYESGRNAEDIVRFGNEKAAENLAPPEVEELISADVLESNCKDNSICILAFLPHILDTGANGRNELLDILRTMTEKFKRNKWGWVWAEGGVQHEVEASVGVGGYGYPALIVLNLKKQVYVQLRSAFDEKHVYELLRDVSVGRGRLDTYRKDGLPSVVLTDPWDGKDGVMPSEEL